MTKQWIGVLLLSLLPTMGMAQESGDGAAEECTQPQELDRYRLLRRMSLDLRQQLPSYQEFAALDEEAELPESVIDDFISSPEFARAMRSFHEGLLWPNPSGADLMDNNTRLAIPKGNGPMAGVYSIISAGRRATYRNDSNTICGSYEQTDFDPDGAPIPQVTGETGSTGKPILQEGWVWVSPYWDPDNPIKVCAFDAQEALEGSKAGVRCDKLTLENVQKNPGFDSGCGCGPNLRWCYGPSVDTVLWEDMREQFGRLIDDVTTAITAALGRDDDFMDVGGVDRTARMLGRLAKTENDRILEVVADEDNPLAERLRRRMVLFSDLMALTNRGIQTLLKQVDRDDLILALKGGTPTEVDRFLENVSSRAAEDIREEMEIMGPVPKSRIRGAQERIVATALKLAEEGAIYLSIGADEDDEDE